MNARAGLSGVIVLAGLLLCPNAAHAAPFTFSLLPVSGEISGLPGSTIGWGYTLSNDSATDWLMLTGLSADQFVNAIPDSSPFDFPILAPGEAHTVAYDVPTVSGLFQLTWDALAPEGFTNAGLFVLSAEFWDANPLAGGSFLAFADDQSAAYSASVAPVPEPGTLLLTATAIGLGAALRRRRRAPGCYA